MYKKWLAGLWGGLFIVCAALGFIQQPQGALKIFICTLSLLFFVPPALLLYAGSREKNLFLLTLIRNLSFLSLLVTLLLLAANILAAPGSETVGSILNSILIIVSTPMMACGSWVLSLFLWACLLMASLRELRRGK